MGELQWRVGVCEPDALPPDSTVELVLQYTNRNDYPHHVQSASLARTWDSSHVSHHSVDREIAPGATERLAPIRLTTPRGIGGNQGVRIGFDVGEATDRETTDYERKWGRLPYGWTCLGPPNTVPYTVCRGAGTIRRYDGWFTTGGSTSVKYTTPRASSTRSKRPKRRR